MESLGQYCFISGWGFTMKSDTDQWDEKLQTVGSTIWKTSECRKAAARVHMGTDNIRCVCVRGFICVCVSGGQ